MAVIGQFDFPQLIINHTELNGKSILSNGLEAMQKYNPVTGAVLPLVLRPFRQDPVLAAGGAGNLNGHYVYRLVPYNVNEDEEGQANPIDGEEVAAYEIDLANQSCNINLAALAADNAEVTHVRIYRTIADGAWPVLARVGEVALPAGVFNDNTADDDLDFANEGLDTAIQVPTPKPFICTHGSRVFGWGDIPYSEGRVDVTTGDDEVAPVEGAVFGFHLIGKEFHAEGDGRAYMIDAYDPATGNIVLRDNYAGATRTTEYRICGDADTLIWTDPFFEHKWPAFNNLPINKKEDDKPAGIMPQGRRLLLPKSKKTYTLYYNTNPSYEYSSVSTVSTEYGCVSHRSMVLGDGGVAYWMSKDGIVAIVPDGGLALASVALGSWVYDNLQLDVTGEQQMCMGGLLKRKGQYLAFIPGQDAELGCDYAIVWHYLEKKFSIFRFRTEFTALSRVVNTEGEEVLVLGDRHGYLWEYPYGDLDGAPVNSTYSGTVDAYWGTGSPYCSLTDNDAQFPTTGLGLAGVPVYIHNGTGAGQWGIVAANTENTLYLEDCFAVALDETSEYYVGNIEARYKTGWHDYGTIDRIKRMMYANLVFEKNDSNLQFNMYGDFSDTAENLEDKNYRATDPTDYGLVNMNGDDESTITPRGRKRVPLGGIRKTHLAWELYDDRPNNPWSIYDVSMDVEMETN